MSGDGGKSDLATPDRGKPDRGIARPCGRIAAWSQRRRMLVLSSLGIVTALALLMMSRLSISGDLSDAVGRASPAAGALGAIGERFDVGDELLVVATVRDEVGTAEARAALTAFAAAFERELLEDPRSEDLVRGVTWRGRAEDAAWLDELAIPAAPLLLDDDGFEALVARLSGPEIRARIARLEALLAAPGPLAQSAAGDAARDPLGIRDLVIDHLRDRAGPIEGAGGPALSRDGRSLLIRVATPAGPGDLARAKELVALVRELTEREGIGVALTGAPAIAAYSASSVRRDLIASVVGAVVAIQILFLLIYRGLAAFIIVVIPAALGIVWAFGAQGIAGELTVLGAAIGAILVGLGIDYAVHAASGAGGDASRAMARVGPGIIAAAVTTIIAFAALLTSRLDILRGFAGIGALGLAGAALATFLLMPILLNHRVRPRQLATRAGAEPSPAFARGLIAASAVVLVACVGLITITLARGSALVPLQDDLDAMHPRPNPPLEASRAIGEAFPGPDEGYPVLIRAESDGQLVARAHEVSRALLAGAGREAGVLGVWGVDALIPDPARVEARRRRVAEIDADSVIASLRGAIEESRLAPSALEGAVKRIETMLRAPGAPSLSDLRAHTAIAAPLLPAESAPALPEDALALSYVRIAEPAEGRTDRARTITTLKSLLADVQGATLTGLPVLAHETERLATREAPRLLAIALIGVLAWLAVFFRRPLDVALALVPGAFAFAVMLALLAPLGIELNIINIAAFPLLVGIGVDDGIFLVAAARATRRDSARALRERTRGVSHAIVTTSLTTLLAFGSLALTSTPAVRSLGLLVVIGVSACLWGSLFLLAPSLMLLASRRDRLRGATS